MSSCARVRWNGGARAFIVDTDVNVRATFGSGAFLVDVSQRVVSLDAGGKPVEALKEGGDYTVFSGGSRELQKQTQVLRGKLATAANEQLKLRERIAKFEECTLAELHQLRLLLQQPQLASGRGAESALGADAATSIGDAQNEPALASASDSEGGRDAAVVPLLSLPGRENRQPQKMLPRADLGEWTGRPIGVLRTCFVEKNGTPRQGCIVPSSAAELTVQLGGGLNATHALDGLSSFSHVCGPSQLAVLCLWLCLGLLLGLCLGLILVARITSIIARSLY